MLNGHRHVHLDLESAPLALILGYNVFFDAIDSLVAILDRSFSVSVG